MNVMNGLIAVVAVNGTVGLIVGLWFVCYWIAKGAYRGTGRFESEVDWLTWRMFLLIIFIAGIFLIGAYN